MSKNTPVRAQGGRHRTARLLYYLIVFAMYAALMFTSKKMMEFLPNVHLLGTLIMVATIAWRGKALIPIYVYVFLDGFFSGFSPWWYPYLYLWAVLWGMTMLLPKRMSKKVATVVYPLVCALHGLLFGILYAPAQAFLFGLNYEGMIAWIVAGIPFDILHAVSNFAVGLLVLPLSQTIQMLEKRRV